MSTALSHIIIATFCAGGVVLVRLDQPQLERAQGEDLFCNLLAQARNVEVFDVSQQVFHACGREILV
jgi:hypothetical protein